VAENFPTEECFTSPDPDGTEGTFRCSRPLTLPQGRVIEGIEGEFRGGRLVRLDAAEDEDRDLLASFLDGDSNARRLGEVALVDASSRVGQSDRIYATTLIDENAAAHIGFGLGFKQTRGRGSRARVNTSSLHLDVMIGTDDFEAIGFAGRRRVPLLTDGEWKL
jgi:aminopeptidase